MNSSVFDCSKSAVPVACGFCLSNNFSLILLCTLLSSCSSQICVGFVFWMYICCSNLIQLTKSVSTGVGSLLNVRSWPLCWSFYYWIQDSGAREAVAVKSYLYTEIPDPGENFTYFIRNSSVAHSLYSAGNIYLRVFFSLFASKRLMTWINLGSAVFNLLFLSGIHITCLRIDGDRSLPSHIAVYTACFCNSLDPPLVSGLPYVFSSDSSTIWKHTRPKVDIFGRVHDASL